MPNLSSDMKVATTPPLSTSPSVFAELETRIESKILTFRDIRLAGRSRRNEKVLL